MSAFSTKQRVLTEQETRGSLEAWCEQLMYHISNEDKFERYLLDLNKWKSTATANRGFTADAVETNGSKMTAEKKFINLKVLLGFISIHAPVISSSFIKEEACSLEEIFTRLRQYYDCRKSGTKIMEMFEQRCGPTETREACWEKCYSFMEDSLITKASGIKHCGAKLGNDEHLTPTLQNITVMIWLDAIHKDLPALVKQRFAITLRDSTLYSIRTEISDAIPSLLQEISDREGTISFTSSRRRKSSRPERQKTRQRTRPKCCLCDAANRPGSETHFFQSCPFLPVSDRKYLRSKINDIEVQQESSSEDENDDEYYETIQKSDSRSVQVRGPIDNENESKISRVDIVSSPCMEIQIGNEEADVTLDTGAESNLIRKSEARRLKLNIQPTTHKANMADGVSPMEIAGEVHFNASRKCPITKKTHTFRFDGLVVKDLNCSILGGMPFLDRNDIYLRPNINSVYLGDCCNFKYISIRRCASVRAATILRVPRQMCLLPDSHITLPLPPEYCDEMVSVEPRQINDINDWIKCDIVNTKSGEIVLKNETHAPILIKRHEQLCQVRHTTINPSNQVSNMIIPPLPTSTPTETTNLAEIIVDPSNIFSSEEKQMFSETNQKYPKVFSPSLGCYNGYSGKFEHKINMSSSLPPQRKGRIPMYNRSNLENLQAKIDELYKQGVFVRPEDVNITAEYISPSFLVAKSSGGHRLVTAFTELGQYTKPQPALMSKVDDIIRHIGQFKYLIKADLKQAYFQIPLAKSSMKYVGICTPFRGVLVYTRAVMGLPGSESALEQLMSKVLGDLMVEGCVVKLADDLYAGANTTTELNSVWEKVLEALHNNNLRLSPNKTIICPTSTEILGWQWENGTLRATSHRLNTLAVCDPPQTIKNMRSFIGSYKFLSKVIPKHSDFLAPLDKACSKGASSDKIVWTTELENAFQKAKDHLKENKILTLPRKEDKLQIITDAAAISAGLAASLFVIRESKPSLAGLFNARKTSSQAGWLACELEALGIAAAVKHFSPYIIQSQHTTEVLTDSLPCVQAYDKLQRGAFSNSSRVTTFLSTVSRYHVKLSHISGNLNIADYPSRNPIPCDGCCQICKFIDQLDTSVVREITVKDILAGHCQIPYMTRNTWIQAQQECPDLNQVYRLLRDGRTPSKKKKGMTTVKRYLQHCKLSTTPADGLIIVTQEEALRPTRQRIVIPKSVLDGLLVALHIQLQHASKYQLKQVFNMGFYALDTDKAISRTIDSCHVCMSLKKIPSQFKEQTTTKPPDKIGTWFASDIINRENQRILLIRENISSLTHGTMIPSETSQSFRDGLITTISRFRPPSGSEVVIRVDGASGFHGLLKDPLLESYHIKLEIGEAKNINKNPISERSISEFHTELCKLKPQGGKISESELSLIIANMNSRVRESGYSSQEVWTMRDQYTGEKLPIEDSYLIDEKYRNRLKKHEASAKYKGRGKIKEDHVNTKVGEVVYLYQDGVKTNSRSKYIVMEVDTDYCTVQKLTEKQFRGKRYRVRKSDLIKTESYPESKIEPNALRNEDESTNFTPTKLKTKFYTGEFPNANSSNDTQSSESSDIESTSSSQEDLHNGAASDENEENNENDPLPENAEGLRRSSRTRRPPQYLDRDYVMYSDSN